MPTLAFMHSNAWLKIFNKSLSSNRCLSIAIETMLNYEDRKCSFCLYCAGITFVLFLVPNITNGQFNSIKISIKTDSNPENISWNLYSDASNFLLIGDGGTMVNDLEVYEWIVTGNCTDCYRFEINIADSLGLGEGGYYSIQVDEDWIVYQERVLGSSGIHYLGTCSYGDECSNPIAIQDVENSSYIVRPIENSWFTFKPSVDGFYTFNTCFNVDDQGNNLDSKIWIYDECPEVISQGPVGAIYYNDESFFCPPGAYLRNVQFVKDREYIVRLGNLDESWGEKIIFQVSRSADLLGCTDPSSCVYNPFATVDDASCVIETTCGPDLWINDTLLMNSVYLDTISVTDACLLQEDCIGGMGLRDIVRFSTAIYNIGDADFIVGDPTLNPDGFSDDNCHDHWHQLGYAEYLVYAGAGQPEPVSLKNGFCMLDIGCTEEVYLPKYSCSFMGITAGCFDVYDSSLPCQWIDVTDMEDGDYTLAVRINWNRSADLRGMKELSYDNNWAQVCISLDRSSGDLELSINENCATYVDCFGRPFGSAVFDCEGECNGIAHLGDIDGNYKVDSLDVESYFDLLKNSVDFIGECSDLDQNGMLNLYDAVLVQECISSIYVDEADPEHGHCVPQRGVTNIADTVWVRISNLDEVNKTFDIEYYSPQANIIGLHVEIEGADIVDFSVVRESLFDYKVNGTNDLYLLSKNQYLPFNFSFAKAITISYDNIIGNSICIVSVSDAINKENQLLPSFVEGGCESHLVSNATAWIKDHDVVIYPNPSSDNFSMEIIGSENLISYELYSSNGMMTQRKENLKTKNIVCKTEGMIDGIYYIKTLLSDQSQSYHKIVIAN